MLKLTHLQEQNALETIIKDIKDIASPKENDIAFFTQKI